MYFSHFDHTLLMVKYLDPRAFSFVCLFVCFFSPKSPKMHLWQGRVCGLVFCGVGVFVMNRFYSEGGKKMPNFISRKQIEKFLAPEARCDLY